MIAAFIYGVILAFGLIIPLGVQNIFIFNQGATQHPFRRALPSILSASLCDTLLIIVAVLGLSAIALHFAWVKTVIFTLGFFFLLYMGWVIWNNKPLLLEEGHPKALSPKRQIIFTMSVSILNPHALIDSVAVIGTNALRFSGHARLAYTLGCIVVSFCWFFGLAMTGHVMHRLDKTGKWIILINKLSAIIMWTIAFLLAWQLSKLL